jgi:UDP-N-acetylmuramate dehydrogenase
MGGAQVSPRHGNFIVNAGGATAADVRALADEVRRRVACAFGVELREEIIYVGEWPGRYEDA